jgi:hypothetical protein
MNNLAKFLKSGEYLPKPIRDFHDAKDVFKTMHATVAVEKNEYAKEINWVAGQCYVIDVFLWFMARRGWTLQRCRRKIEFLDLDADVEAQTERDLESLKAIIEDKK